MTKFKLTKKIFNNNRFMLLPNYISNGHWMIHRDFVSNNSIFQSRESITHAFKLNSRRNNLEHLVHVGNISVEENFISKSMLTGVALPFISLNRTGKVGVSVINGELTTTLKFSNDDGSISVFFNALYMRFFKINGLAGINTSAVKDGTAYFTWFSNTVIPSFFVTPVR